MEKTLDSPLTAWYDTNQRKAMKKKLGSVLLVLVMGTFLFAAGDWRYVFWNLDQHPEIVSGFLPTQIGMGAGWDGLHLIPDRRTEIQALVGGGYYQRKMWQNPTNGLPLEQREEDDPLIYDVMEYEWRLRFSQGFLPSNVQGKDLWTVYAGYDGFFTRTMDSMVTGASRSNNGSHEVASVAVWFSSHSSSSADNAYYTDMGDSLLTVLFAGIKWDRMEDKLTTQDGIYSDLRVEYAPLALNSALDGRADYYSITSNTVAGKTLYQLKDSKDKNLFSIVVVDRLHFNWTDGSAVPMKAQKTITLGRVVRGFNSFSYNYQFTSVNNFDVRFCGPEPWLKGLLPRVNVFFDIGYGCGNYLNTSVWGDQLLSSAGVQVTVSFFDFIDLGLQYAYLFKGTNFVHYGDNLVMSVTFFLDF